MVARISRRGFEAVATIAALSAFTASAGAQGFNNLWVQYANETSTRLGVAATAVSSNNDEIDFDSGDLDKNGYPDLVVARKQPFTTGGKRPNMLLMNEGGVLKDRTALYASASDVVGDQGFLTQTNDRDVRVVDVDGDGWLDVVTSVVISFSDPKHISHPRVYRNLGANGSGQWLGLKFENARIPQLMVGSSPTGGNSCSILAGDVTGDGRPDLYLVDYDISEVLDTQDRLLINDGNGYFTDESTTRMTGAMLASGFGNAGAIIDVNGDGRNDIMKTFAGPTTVAYNNPAQPGYFNLFDTAGSGSNYNMNAGDLNNDGKVDYAVSDDGTDTYRYNTGNDALGRVIWGPYKPYQFLAGGDDGIGGNVNFADLNKDGWLDTLHADVDVDIPGCGNRLHVYHNPGGTPGAQITLREERESSAASSWLGAKGLNSNDLIGAYDTAVLDIDADGNNDLVIGRCAGTYVFMNQAVGCAPIAKPASLGDGHLSVCGQSLSTGHTSTLEVTGGPINGIGLLTVGTAATTQFAFGGQVMVPISLMVVVPLDIDGKVSLVVPGGGGPSGGVSFFVQALLAEPSKSTPTDITEVVQLVFLP